jgi:hypothetical protein
MTGVSTYGQNKKEAERSRERKGVSCRLGMNFPYILLLLTKSS